MPISLSQTSANDDENILSSTVKLMLLFGIYVFLSGWSSLDSYYRFFGMDLKSLDIGLYDTLLRGFTILFPVRHPFCSWLFYGSGRLWFVYLVVILGPIVAKRYSRYLLAWGLKADITWVGLLLASLLLVYLISFKAGEERARIDTTTETTLPTIIFQVRKLNLPTEKQRSADGSDAKEPTCL